MVSWRIQDSPSQTYPMRSQGSQSQIIHLAGPEGRQAEDMEDGGSGVPHLLLTTSNLSPRMIDLKSRPPRCIHTWAGWKGFWITRMVVVCFGYLNTGVVLGLLRDRELR